MAEETSNEKWLRISDSRAEKAEKALTLLAGNLASGYEYSPEQAQALVERMQATMNEVREAYGFPALEMSSEAEDASETSEASEEETAEVEPEAIAKAPVASAPATAASTATVAASPFPNEEEDMILLRVGSRIDNAITMIEKNQPLEAKAILHAMLVS